MAAEGHARDLGVHVGDLGVHVGDPGVHTPAIRALTHAREPPPPRPTSRERSSRLVNGAGTCDIVRMSRSPSAPDTLRAHLEQLDASALRDVLVELSADLEPTKRALLVDIATRKVVKAKGRRALPSGEDPQRLAADASRYARSIRDTARGDPADIDALFARLNAAWMRGEHQAFRAGVMEIAGALDGGVDLGHDELYSEVLATDVHELAHRLLVSVYLTTPAGERPAEVAKANDAMDVLMATTDRPIHAMEKVALEPFPDLDDFARAWAAHLRAQVGTRYAKGFWAFEQQLREATSRSEGASGLAALARASNVCADYVAWAEALRAAGDLSSAAMAAREGAEAMNDGRHRANLLTLAGHIELERKNAIEPDLRAALIADPTARRLRRWLASVPIKKRSRAIRQLDLSTTEPDARLILHALRSDWAAVAKLIETGATLGWSRLDHSGHVGTEAVVWALAPTSSRVREPGTRSSHDTLGQDDPSLRSDGDVSTLDGFHVLPEPTLTKLLDELEASRPTAAEAKVLRDAMAKAAVAGVEGIAGSAHRSRYGDAARLVALSAALHVEAGDASAAASLISKAREATGRKWSFTHAIDDAVSGKRR